ncbi:hypothetical protein RRG08_058051 [Elysia crispata]|uniref:Sodium/solute symporter n=1 Tax=Elysia crispata TaxID=231223 RepID=A0AAE1A8J4_9GAST|nr:hypothetical protein RRG08_058051 [Elysia crispata]
MSATNATGTSSVAPHQFYVVDYVVFGITIFISLGIGVFHAIAGRQRNNTDEYIVGGRSMGFLPIAISLIASFESSIMMLGLPAEAYVFGFQYVWWIAGMCVSQLLAVNIIVPLLHPLKITSAYEYLELRFQSRAVRLVGTTMGTVSYAWYMGVVLFGPAVALQAVAGYPVWNSILVICVVAVIYTAIGGIRAVIWTDVFQGLVMLAGIFAILIQGTVEVGSPKKVWDVANAGGRLNFFNFDPDPRVRHTFWNLFVGSMVRGFGMLFNQSSVQRISSTRTVSEAKKMMMFTCPVFFITATIATYEGIVSYAYYDTKGCDPLASRQITNPNQIVPYTVMDIFSNLRGMPGLFLASLFSASLSTLSSGLASCAALVWTDVVHPMVGEISENKSTVILKVLVVIFGCIACGVSFMVAEIGGTLTQIGGTLISAFSGPLTGIFFLGCFVPRSNAKGAIVGGLVAMAVCIWIGLGQNFSPNIPKPTPLPFASMENCAAPASPLQEAFSTVFGVNLTDSATTPVVRKEPGEPLLTTAAAMYLNTTQAPPAPPRVPSGIDVIYTLSYQYISAVGVFGTMIVGTIVSLITGMNEPGDVDPKYLTSVTESFLFFLPASVRRWISSFGPQFMDDTHRSKDGGDPGQKELELVSRVEVIAEKPMNEMNGDYYKISESYKF